MKTPVKIILCAIALAIAVFLLFQKRTASHQPARNETTASRTPRPAAPAALPFTDEPAGPATPAPVALATPQPDETSATLQMYAAHAPLRVPELADPDSATNRQILQTMVQKALQRTAADAPPSNTDRNQ